MIKFKDLVEDIKKEIEQDEISEAKVVLKERLLEIKELKRCIAEAEIQLEKLLEENIGDVI